MIVQVIKDYFDLKDNNKLRKSGELLEYKDNKRAKELISKGVVIERKIEIIKKETEKVEEKEGA